MREKYKVTWTGRNGQTVEKLVTKSQLANLIEEATSWGHKLTIERAKEK